MSKKCILFFSEAVTVAHVVRLWQLAKSLDTTVYDVHFAVADRYTFVFDERHITRHRLFSIPSDVFIHRVENAKAMYSTQELTHYVKDDLAIIEHVKPDIVVGDMRQSLCVSSRLTGVHHVALANAYWHDNFHKMHFPVPEIRQFNLSKIPGIRSILPLYYAWFFRYQGKTLNALRQQFKLPAFAHCLDGWNYGDTVIFSDPSLLFNKYNCPPAHHFIGPVFWEPEVEEPSWWCDLDNSKQTAYVSLGSSGDNALLPSLIKLLSEQGFQIILNAPREQLNLFCENHIYGAEFISGSKAAARADVVISNGGSPTSYQAFSVGTPVIGVPRNLDQLMSLSFIEAFKVGITLRPNDINRKQFKKSLHDIIHDKDYKYNAKKLAKNIAESTPEEKFSKVITNLLNQGNL